MRLALNKLAFGLLVVLLANNAIGQEPNAQIPPNSIKGIGFSPCSTLIEMEENGYDLYFVESWFFGYWSAMNLMRTREGKESKNLYVEAMEYGKLSQVILGECLQKPDEIVANVVLDLFNGLPEADDE